MKLKFVMSKTRLTIVTVTLLLLPVCFIILSYAFRHEVTLDPPKLMEEIAKAILAVFLALASLFISELLERKHLGEKCSAILGNINTQLAVYSQILNSITEACGLRFENLDSSEIIENQKYRVALDKQVALASRSIETILSTLYNEDAEIVYYLRDQAKILSSLMVALHSFQSDPNSQNLKQLIAKIQVVINKFQFNSLHQNCKRT